MRNSCPSYRELKALKEKKGVEIFHETQVPWFIGEDTF